MKKLITAHALLVVALLLTSCGGSDASTAPNASSERNTVLAGTTPFASEEGAFKVTLPPGYATPKESRNEQTGWISYLSAGPKGNACAAGFRSISPEIVSALDSPEKKQEALEIFRDDSLKGMQAGGMTTTTEKEEKITVADHPGLLVVGSAEGKGTTTHFRIANILANSSAYRISCFSATKATLDKPEILAFFGSLKFD